MAPSVARGVVRELDKTYAHALMQRLVAKAEPAPAPDWMDTPCLVWQGKAQVSSGYGAVSVLGNVMHVSRASYLSQVGPIGVDENGRTLDVYVLCANKRCINPDHLEAITHAEARARQHAYRTHCNHGHELTEENTYLHPAGSRGKSPVRTCRECGRQDSRTYAAKQRKRRSNQTATQAESAPYRPAA